MSRDTRSYGDAVSASEPASDGDNPYAPLEVRVIEHSSRRSMRRSSYEYVVVDHEAETVLYEGRPARPHGQNPSSAEESARAHGFASGVIRGRND